LWRFNDHHSNVNTNTNTNASVNTVLQQREKRASIGVSIVLAILGFGGLITAVDDLATGYIPVENNKFILYYLSFTSFVLFGVLAKFKFHYAKKLKSPSLRKDGLCSAIGCILGFAMFFNALLGMISTEAAWWWLDPSVAFVCAVGALGYGLYGMYKAYVKDGYPIFNFRWWLYGGGGKMEDQGQGRSVEQMQHQHNHNGLDQEIGGDLEMQTSTNNDSLAGNPSMSTPTVSGEDEMSDIVIT